MRSNYSREERQKIVEEYIQSGKSQTVFAPEYGIKMIIFFMFFHNLFIYQNNFLLSNVSRFPFVFHEENVQRLHFYPD